MLALINNTSVEYIRKFAIGEARILAVVGLHGNTFKPHTGTKTSVLFLQKYTNEEKKNIQQIEAKYEGECEDFIAKLKTQYKGTTWSSELAEEQLSEELRAFIESYFGVAEELLDSSSTARFRNFPDTRGL